MVYITDTATVDSWSKIRDDAQVRDTAFISNSLLNDSAIIAGQASFMNSTASNSSRISDQAYINVSDIYDNAHIYGKAKLSGIMAMGNTHIFGNAKLVNQMLTRDRIILKGNCKFGGKANFENLYNMKDFIKKYGSNKVDMVGRDVQLTDVWDMG